MITDQAIEDSKNQSALLNILIDTVLNDAAITLQQLSGILTVDEMRKLNYAVDGEKRQPREVAREFLKLKNIIQ